MPTMIVYAEMNMEIMLLLLIGVLIVLIIGIFVFSILYNRNRRNLIKLCKKDQEITDKVKKQ